MLLPWIADDYVRTAAEMAKKYEAKGGGYEDTGDNANEAKKGTPQPKKEAVEKGERKDPSEAVGTPKTKKTGNKKADDKKADEKKDDEEKDDEKKDDDKEAGSKRKADTKADDKDKAEDKSKKPKKTKAEPKPAAKGTREQPSVVPRSEVIRTLRLHLV